MNLVIIAVPSLLTVEQARSAHAYAAGHLIAGRWARRVRKRALTDHVARAAGRRYLRGRD